MFLFLCLVAILCVWKTYIFIHVQMKRSALSAIPQPPLDSISGGHEPSVNKAKDENRFLDLFVDWIGLYGNTILFYIGARPFIFTADPNMLKLVSTDLISFKKVAALPNRSLFGQKIIGTDSILSGGGLRWAVKRKCMSQFFAKNNMSELFKVCKPHMEGRDLLRWKDLIKKGNTIELHDQLSITFTSYLHCLGLEKFLTADDIADKTANILEAIPKPLFQRYSYIISSDKTRMFKLIKQMRSDAQQVILERYEEISNNPDEPIPKMDMLAYLIEANKSNDGQELNTQEFVVESVVDDVITVCLVMDNMVKQVCALFMFLNDVPEVQV